MDDLRPVIITVAPLVHLGSSDDVSEDGDHDHLAVGGLSIFSVTNLIGVGAARNSAIGASRVTASASAYGDGKMSGGQRRANRPRRAANYRRTSGASTASF